MAAPRSPMSLRSKLVIITVTLGFFVIALVSSVSLVTLQRSLESRLDLQLASAFDRAVNVLNAPGFRGVPDQSIEDRRGRELRERDLDDDADNRFETDDAENDTENDTEDDRVDDLDDGLDSSETNVDSNRALRVTDAAQILNGPAQAPGTLALVLDQGTLTAGYLDDDGEIEAISSQELDVLSQITPDAQPHTVNLGEELGVYRVQAAIVNDNAVVVGLPFRDVQQTVVTLGMALLTLALLGLAALAVVATLIIRRTMRPLEQVAVAADTIAQTELSRGEVSRFERVSVPDVGERTEVGRVVNAVNSMMANVESALNVREASEQKLRSFVADASHELRTPLASIRGYSELVRRMGGELPPDMLQAIGRIESESIRMTELVEDLLLLARLDQGAELSLERVDIAELVATAVSDAEISESGSARVGGSGSEHDDDRTETPTHEWIFSSPSSPLVVMGDRNRLYQVFANLLSNARLHTPPDTRITVAVEAQDDTVEVTVADNGPGIEPELQSTVFSRFVRGDASRTKRSTGGGTGLGLSIAQAIVQAHGGSITVQSEPGTTVFTVSLRAPDPMP